MDRKGPTVNLCAVYRDVWSSNSHYPNSFSHRLIVIQPTMSERGLTESLYFWLHFYPSNSLVKCQRKYNRLLNFLIFPLQKAFHPPPPPPFLKVLNMNNLRIRYDILCIYEDEGDRNTNDLNDPL